MSGRASGSKIRASASTGTGSPGRATPSLAHRSSITRLCAARAVRGRGIGRALEYESIGQAIEAGTTRVRTNNDVDNPPILRINEAMGYRLVTPVIELHRELDSGPSAGFAGTSP